MEVMQSIKLLDRTIGVSKHHNCKMTIPQVLQLRLCYPFFSIKDPSHYADSALGKIYSCGKDMFYRLQNNGNINWRNIFYRINKQILKEISDNTEVKESDNVVCLVVDDSDLPKSGMHLEDIGKIYSHTQHKSILGHKFLSLLRTDGKTQTMLDFSLCGEEGKNHKKKNAKKANRKSLKQGLTEEQREARMHKDHTDEAIKVFEDEYFENKIDKSINMIKRAIQHKITFDYLLTDSWFVSAKLIKFITGRHIKCHLLGMAKMSKTKYSTEYGELTANEIVCKKKKEAHSCKRLHCKHFTIDVKYAGHKLRLFFCRRGHKGDWNVLLTTDLSLDFFKAYEIYSRRWVTETSYKEEKCLLGLGKCESQNFTAQVAAIAMTIIQYNILCAVKRFDSYESIGTLFKEAIGGTVELSISEKIWDYILDVILIVSEAMSSDATTLLQMVIDNDPLLAKFSKLNINQQAA